MIAVASASGTAASLVFAAGGVACGAVAVAAVVRRQNGSVRWRGATIGYGPRATFFALMSIGLLLYSLADLLAEGDRRHAGCLIAMTALVVVAAGVVVGGLAERIARRETGANRSLR
jgi:hypothetical protein